MSRSALYGTAIVAAYLVAVAGESMGPPYGALIDLACTDGGHADRCDAADGIRSWRIWPPARAGGGVSVR
ncbi:hypothetical protein [Streptomyces sp. NPDC047070]|uniref:hypothetical protein n=1 Tax=Streptomyces sp. NPDC047070 TaxID=3154923 RepID=UPI003454A267